MNGEQFVSILSEFEMHIEPATKSQWRQKEDITPTLLRNALQQFERQKLTQAVAPIVEFHKLHFDHKKNKDTFANRISNKAVVGRLQNSSGIYAFYEARGRLVYVGKTQKNNLMSEMGQRYGNKEVSFRVVKNGKAQWEPAYIKDVAHYFSAYKVN